jgi:hypothetical protein
MSPRPPGGPPGGPFGGPLGGPFGGPPGDPLGCALPGVHMVVVLAVRLAVRRGFRLVDRRGFRLAVRRGFHLVVRPVHLAVHYTSCRRVVHLTIYRVRLVPDHAFCVLDHDAALCRQSRCRHCRHHYRTRGLTVWFGDVDRDIHCFCRGLTVCSYVFEEIGLLSDDCPHPAGMRFALRHCANWLAVLRFLRESS